MTIATNMAGRGTDIKLGGNWEVEVAALNNPSEAQIAEAKADWQARHDAVMEAGGYTLSVLSAMNLAESTTSFVVAQAVKVTRVAVVSSCP